jgi:hypothetical protein
MADLGDPHDVQRSCSGPKPRSNGVDGTKSAMFWIICPRPNVNSCNASCAPPGPTPMRDRPVTDLEALARSLAKKRPGATSMLTRGAGGDLNGHPARDHRPPPHDRRVDQPNRVDDPDHSRPLAASEALVKRTDGPALGSGRDACRPEPVPQGQRVPAAAATGSRTRARDGPTSLVRSTFPTLSRA